MIAPLMRAALALPFLLVACGSGETSPAGPVGKAEDLRKHVKGDAAARAPKDTAGTTPHEAKFDISGIKTKVTWNVWEDPTTHTKHILELHWDVVTPRDGYTFKALGSMNPVNAGTANAAVMRIPTMVEWHDNTSSGKHWGQVSVMLDANGTATRL